MTVVCAFDELPDCAPRRFEIDGIAVSVVRIGDAVHAVDDVCTHANVSLSEGEVWCDEMEIECPKHGSAFNLVTGEPSTLPATQPVAVHRVEVVDGDVDVTLADGGAPS